MCSSPNAPSSSLFCLHGCFLHLLLLWLSICNGSVLLRFLKAKSAMESSKRGLSRAWISPVSSRVDRSFFPSLHHFHPIPKPIQPSASKSLINPSLNAQRTVNSPSHLSAGALLRNIPSEIVFLIHFLSLSFRQHVCFTPQSREEWTGSETCGKYFCAPPPEGATASEA